MFPDRDAVVAMLVSSLRLIHTVNRVTLSVSQPFESAPTTTRKRIFPIAQKIERLETHICSRDARGGQDGLPARVIGEPGLVVGAAGSRGAASATAATSGALRRSGHDAGTTAASMHTIYGKWHAHFIESKGSLPFEASGEVTIKEAVARLPY